MTLVNKQLCIEKPSKTTIAKNCNFTFTSNFLSDFETLLGAELRTLLLHLIYYQQSVNF